RVANSTANRTYSRRSRTVSTVKKSTATTPVAWARRNCRQVSADRLDPDPRRRAVGWSTRCWPDPAPVAQAAQLAVDAPISPGRVLPGQSQHQRADLRPHRWPATLVRIGPAALYQGSMPAQQRRRLHDTAPTDGPAT